MNLENSILLLVYLFIFSIIGIAFYTSYNEYNKFNIECKSHNYTYHSVLECIELKDNKVIIHNYLRLNNTYYEVKKDA
jgi:hypothetical protein